MKILMISEKDAANMSLAKIADAFLMRGHFITIYAPYFAENVLKFFNKNINILPINKLTDSVVEECDIIFASTMSSLAFTGKVNILSFHKPIITQSYLINKQLQWGGEACFVSSLDTSESDYDKYVKRYLKIGIGEPKYDDSKLVLGNSKRLLFIDSGHYPFSSEGKKELAKTLLNICKSFPDYELCIKPRFLPGDKVITHANKLHLYDIIKNEANGKVPSNLTMLTEHRDLKELIDSSHTVICMYTTAFVGAYTSGKGLVILENLPSEDIYDVRWKSFNNIRDYMIKSGALIDYKKVNDILPHGVKCSEAYFDYLLAEKENVSNKICEVTEYLYEKFYKYDKFPYIADCSYKDYKQMLKIDNDMTWEKVINNRYETYFLWKMLIFIDFNINANLNIDFLLNKLNGKFTEEMFTSELEKSNTYRNECIIANRELMLKDEIDAGILLNAYSILNSKEGIKNFPNKTIGAYHLFRAAIAYDEKDFDTVIDEAYKYMKLSLGREFIKEVSDMSNNRIVAFYILIKALLEKNRQTDAEEYLNKMKDYYDLLYPVKNEVIDRVQAQQYTCLKWLEGKVKHSKLLSCTKENEKVFVYGAGMITKKIFLKDQEMKSKIGAFIDLYYKPKALQNIQVIKPEQMTDFKEMKTVVITVTHEFDSIKQELLKIRSDLNVISVNDVFSKGE